MCKVERSEGWSGTLGSNVGLKRGKDRRPGMCMPGIDVRCIGMTK